MEASIRNAISILVQKIGGSTTPDEALKYTQASLNLAHVLATFDAFQRTAKES